ncbi:MAG: hypothetical protein WC699_04260 [Bacteroidales bacterium]|jgi:hypothetical protein
MNKQSAKYGCCLIKSETIKSKNAKKTRSILLALALVLVAFSSCSKINDALTVKVPVDFTNDLQVHDSTSGLKSTAGFYFFQADATFNPSTDATVIQYKSKIKSITASGISFTPRLCCILGHAFMDT